MTADLGSALASLFSRRCIDDPDADITHYCHTRKCNALVKGHPCGETTREGKEFCTKHVENHPYIKNLMQRMKVRETEDHTVMMEGSKAVNLNGLTVQEILIHMRQTGTKTVEGLSKSLGLEKTILQKYLFALRDKNRVELVSTARESMAVRLVMNDDDELFGDEGD